MRPSAASTLEAHTQRCWQPHLQQDPLGCRLHSQDVVCLSCTAGEGCGCSCGVPSAERQAAQLLQGGVCMAGQQAVPESHGILQSSI